MLLIVKLLVLILSASSHDSSVASPNWNCFWFWIDKDPIINWQKLYNTAAWTNSSKVDQHCEFCGMLNQLSCGWIFGIDAFLFPKALFLWITAFGSTLNARLSSIVLNNRERLPLHRKVTLQVVSCFFMIFPLKIYLCLCLYEHLCIHIPYKIVLND